LSSINEINTIEDWDRTYLKRLAFFVSLSAILHVVFFGSFLVFSLFMAGGKGISVELFSPGMSNPSSPSQPYVAGLGLSERIKIFRIDFFKEIIPWSPPAVAAELVVEEIPQEPVIEEPVVEEVIPVEIIEPPEEPTDEISNIFNEPFDIPEPVLMQPDISGLETAEGTLPDAFGAYGTSGEGDPNSNVYPLPDWKLTDKDGLEWKSEYFTENYTIYIIGDVSTRHGMEDILAWNYVLRQLTTNPQAAWPPNIVTVATSLEGYYQYDEDDIVSLLADAHDSENTFGVQIADPDGIFPLSLGYTQLPQPVTMFVDDNGFIRLIMIGRIKDISMSNIEATMDIIAEMWQWDENERAILPTVVTLLINLLRDTAYDEENRRIPPEDYAYLIAPTWGYPENYENLDLQPEDMSYYYAPF